MPRCVLRLPRSVRSALALTGAAVGALAGSACGRAPAAFGPTTAAARTHGEDFFGGLAIRFQDVQRTPKFAAGRAKLGRFALSPSKLMGDTVVWTTATGDGVRLLELEGRPDGSRYWFVARSGAPAPDRPGEARHLIRLLPQRDGVYQWNTVVEHAVGRVRADEVADALVLALSRLGRPGRDVRAELRSAMPRSSAALGRLFSLDSVASTPLGDGTWDVGLRIQVHPERLKATMPAFAAYVDKYVSPSRYRFELVDGRGGRWLQAEARKRVLTFRLRLKDGELVDMDGPPRPLPDALQLRGEAFLHVMLWDVGVSDWRGDFTFVRSAHERGFAVRWHERPDWHLPLGVRHLINGTLDRPFAGPGMQLRLTVRDADAGQTLVLRRFDVAVQESAIVRWLGGIGGRAMEDFAGTAEAEENRFTADALLGLRHDLTAALGG